MENASKALLIAAAILIAIILITLGIYVLNQGSEVVKSNNLSEVEIMQFNEKFTSFEGTNVKGSQVNSLLTRVVQNNVANTEDTSKQVTVDATAATEWQSGTKPTGKQVSASYAKALTGKTYKVTCDVDQKTGLVTKVTIATPSTGE